MPDDVEFLTKPALATGMICRALNAGVPARWVAGDEVYGADPAWALTSLNPLTRAQGDSIDTQCWWLLVRHHRGTGELAFYRCYSPEPVPLMTASCRSRPVIAGPARD